MQRLKRDMLERYDIPVHAPGQVRAAMFGLGEALLGVAARLLDAAAPDLGIACVPSDAPWTGDGADPAALLREQEGLYTVLARGYEGETPVNREIVVQSILRVTEGREGLWALAVEPALALGLLDTECPDPEADLRSAAALLAARHRAGLPGLTLLCLGEDEGCADRARNRIAALAKDAAGGFGDWLAACEFCPALPDGFVRRADGKEAAAQCAKMNYADGMLHLAEPYARLTMRVSEGFRRRWPWDGAAGIALVDDLGPACRDKGRYVDAGLFAMAAPGWLLGLEGLSDCMKHERLRRFVGRTYYDELLPADPAEREQAAPRVIQAFERFENPLAGNAILPCARPLLGRFRRGALPLIRAAAAEDFEPPRHLAFALAATIMLYAGARRDEKGRYTVARGNQVHILEDDPAALAVFATLAHDMPPEALAYAALADRELWQGEDLRDIDGLEARVALDIANLQRQPDFLPE